MTGPDLRGTLARAALRALGVKDRSRQELETRLRRISEDGVLIAAVLDELEERGLLNDARAAETYARERSGRGFGPAAVRAGLRRRGLAAGDAPVVSRAELDEAAFAALVKKAGGNPPQDARQRAKWLRFLAGRGFSESSARSAMRRLEGADHGSGED